MLSQVPVARAGRASGGQRRGGKPLTERHGLELLGCRDGASLLPALGGLELHVAV